MLSRLDNIAADGSGTTQYAQDSYLGLGTVVKVAHPAVSGGLTLSYGTAANHYSYLDRFGRGKDQIWTNGSGGTTRDRVAYA